MEERILAPGEQVEDRTLAALRPRRLQDWIGQERLRESLTISLTAARQRNEPLEHILFHGPPGLGKTTLAHIIAYEMGSRVVPSSGPSLERPGDLVGILTNLERGDIFFIDEIHRLPRIVEEYMYPAMEELKVDFVIDRGPYAKTIRLDIKPFTLVGATTRAGMLTTPLRERFGIFHHLDFYSPEELHTIILRSASLLNIPIAEDGAREIAGRSRGTPRIANRLLRRVRDFAQVKDEGIITRKVADAALALDQVDHLGLDALDRKFMRVIVDIYQGGPVGIEALAATLNEERDTLIDVVEPFLLKEGFVSRTPSGRKATAAAYRHLGFPLPPNAQERLFTPENCSPPAD